MRADPKSAYAQRRLSIVKLEVAMLDIQVMTSNACGNKPALCHGCREDLPSGHEKHAYMCLAKHCKALCEGCHTIA